MPSSKYGNPRKTTNSKPKNGSGSKASPKLPHGASKTSESVLQKVTALKPSRHFDDPEYKEYKFKHVDASRGAMSSHDKKIGKKNGKKRNKQIMTANRHPM